MVTDTELVNRLHELLRTADLDNTTAASVRRTLEKDLDIDLSDRKPFIREQIDLFFESHNEQEPDEPQNDDAIDNDDDGSEGKHGSDEEEEEEEADNDAGSGDDDDDSDEKRPDKSDKVVKKIGRGFSKPCALSPQLQKLVGVPELGRTEVVKRIWAYIKEKNLQKPSDKRKILCDEILHDIFRVKSINMFQMNKALTKHIWPLDEEEAAPIKTSKKKKRNREDSEEEEEEEEEEDSDAPKEKRKQVKGKGSGFLTPLPISDALVKFFETDDKSLSRSEVVKRMWDYIKRNNLQDPSDRRRILCDDKLKELFEVDSFVGFTMAKLLTPHFIKEK